MGEWRGNMCRILQTAWDASANCCEVTPAAMFHEPFAGRILRTYQEASGPLVTILSHIHWRRLMKKSLCPSVLIALAIACGGEAPTFPVDAGPAFDKRFRETTREVGPGAEYASIQEAVDASNDGDEIIVHAGDYTGAYIDRSVKLIGRDARIVSAPAGNPGAISIEAEDVTIEGFTFEIDQQAIFLVGAAGCSIRNNEFIGDVGIDGGTADGQAMVGCEISDNRFSSSGLALFINLHDGDRDNLITRNVFTAADLFFGSAVTLWTEGISSNEINRNTFELVGSPNNFLVTGISIWWSSESLPAPTDNEFNRNDFSGSDRGLALRVFASTPEQGAEACELLLEGNEFNKNEALDLEDACFIL
jgi:hypothetical protein